MVRTRNQNDIMSLMIIHPMRKITSWQISMVNLYASSLRNIFAKWKIRTNKEMHPEKDFMVLIIGETFFKFI